MIHQIPEIDAQDDPYSSLMHKEDINLHKPLPITRDLQTIIFILHIIFILLTQKIHDRCPGLFHYYVT